MYNKLFTKILDSSVWLESHETRIVWLTLLAAMDEDGFAPFAALGNLANRARVTLEEAQAAVGRLQGPDLESSNPANDGRRIERVPGGWLVLNAGDHREAVTRAISRDQTRERVRRHRAAKKASLTVTPSNASVTQSNGPSRHANGSVTPSETVSETYSEAETEAKAEKDEHARAMTKSSTLPPVWSPHRHGALASGGLIGHHTRCHPVAATACHRGFCVPAWLINQWRQQFDGDLVTADREIGETVDAGMAALGPGPIGDKPKDYWPTWWQQRHGRALIETRPTKASRTADAFDQAAAAIEAREARRRG